jgi:hypothetical protein
MSSVLLAVGIFFAVSTLVFVVLAVRAPIAEESAAGLIVHRRDRVNSVPPQS